MKYPLAGGMSSNNEIVCKLLEHMLSAEDIVNGHFERKFKQQINIAVLVRAWWLKKRCHS